MKKSLIGVAVVAAALASQAESYRIGLWQTKFNLYDQNKWDTAECAPREEAVAFVGPAMAHVRADENNYSTATYVDDVTGISSAWRKQYTTFRYVGEMYLEEGLTYTFGKYLDDGARIVIGGTQVLQDGTYNNFATGSFTAETTGWYPVDIMVGDGTGGKGPSDTGSNPWTGVGLGYNTVGLTEKTAPGDGAGAWHKLVDPGDGTLFRAPTDDSFVAIDAVAKTDDGFVFTVTAKVPCDVKIYAGETAGTAWNATTWVASSATATFTADALTQQIEVPWSSATRPVVALEAAGDDAIGRFREWTDPIPLVPTPVVSAKIKQVGATSATFDVTLDYPILVSGDEPVTQIAAYVRVGEAQPVKQTFGVQAVGTFELTVTGLAEDSAGTVVFGADNGQSAEQLSDEVLFSTAGLAVACPAEVYENDVRSCLFIVSRQLGSEAEDVTVKLAWSGDTMAFAEPLAETVTIPAGALSATVAVKTVDNVEVDAARTLTLTLVEDPLYRLSPVYTATLMVVDDESLTPEVCVWSGNGGDMKWETPSNWQDNRVPRPIDTAKFTSTGLSGNANVLVTADEMIKDLVIETTTAFAISGENVHLTLGGITRVDVEGNEGNHSIAVPLHVYAGSETNCVWNIAGAGNMTINADISKTAGTYVFKTGAGNVNMSYKNTTFTGPWIIREGQITANVDQGVTFRGAVYIGGGDAPAKLYQSQKNSIGGSTPVYIYTNGTFQAGDLDNGRVSNIYVHEGGVARIGSYFYTTSCDLWGGTYNGGATYNAKNITSHASDVTAVFNAYWRFDGYGDYSVTTERGTAPVDLLIKNGLAEGGSGKYAKKAGAGIVKSTVNFGNLKSHFQINAGTWYVDNPGEYGLGIQETTVATGAKIGGTGCVGMKDAKDVATLGLSNGSESNYATLSPGTIDETTGAHIYGTFTSGRESAHNKLTLGNWAHLEIGVGPKNSETKLSDVDKLMVYGNLEIGENCTLDLTTNSAELDEIKGGRYTIVEADKIEGTFATVLKPKNTWKVEYVSETVGEGDEATSVVKSIVLAIPEKGLTISIR